MLKIIVLNGWKVVMQEDKDRAIRAATEFFFKAGINPSEARAEFVRQMAELAVHEPPNRMPDRDKLTGIAATWHAAEKAANVALTEGWMRTDGATCMVTV